MHLERLFWIKGLSAVGHNKSGWRMEGNDD